MFAHSVTFGFQGLQKKRYKVKWMLHHVSFWLSAYGGLLGEGHTFRDIPSKFQDSMVSFYVCIQKR